MIQIVFCYAILASTFTLAKAALAYSQPFFLIAFRMMVGGLLLLGYYVFTSPHKVIIPKKDSGLFLRVALFHIYIAFIFEFWALQYISSSKTCFIYSLTPFISALFSYALYGDRFSIKKFFGLVIGFGGMLPLMICNGLDCHFFSISLPEIVLLCAVTSAAYAWFDIKHLMNKGYSLILINGFAMVVGGIGALVTSYFTESWSPPIYDISSFLYYVGMLIFVSNILFYNLFGSLIRKYSITFVTFVGFLTPLFASLFGWLFLGEQITWHYAISLVMLIIALFLFYFEEQKKERFSVPFSE